MDKSIDFDVSSGLDEAQEKVEFCCFGTIHHFLSMFFDFIEGLLNSIGVK